MITDDIFKLRLQRLFLHFFDIHFLEIKAASQIGTPLEREARLATRLAFLSVKRVYVPISSYFESELCRKLIDELRDTFEHGIIWLVGSGSNIDEFRYSKFQQYRPGSPQYKAYRTSASSATFPPFKTRYGSATNDIVADWKTRLGSGRAVSSLTDGIRIKVPADLEERWAAVPEKLEQKAFIVPHVLPIILPRARNPIIRGRLHAIVNEAYFTSYVKELVAGVVTDLVYLASPHPIPSFGRNLPYRRLTETCRAAGILHSIVAANGPELLSLRDDLRFLACLARTEEDETPTPARAERWTAMPKQLQSFIVHGHDKALLFELKDYIQNTLKLPEPIVLFQQPNAGRTIIEKFEDYAVTIDIAFVLMTPDDLGGKTETVLQKRARQNVIYELGYFTGKLGRLSGRVILLHKGPLEIPSDLYGVTYIDVSKGIKEAGEDIRLELAVLSGEKPRVVKT
jgi:predicted nucleotide-binding protein